MATATDGDLIYVVGGLSSIGKSLSTVEAFNPRHRRWRVGPELPIAVHHAMATGADGGIYVFGGYESPPQISDIAFVLRGDHWQELANMPEPRAAGAAAVIDDVIYIVGGVGPRGLANTMLMFNIKADRWSLSEGPPTLREHLGVAALDGQLLAIGGRTGGYDTNLSIVESYDARTQRWNRLADMPTARGGLAVAATTSGYVIAAGGEAEVALDVVEGLNIKSNEWNRFPSMRSPRHGLGLVVMGSRAYALVGGIEPGLSVSDTAEVIDVSILRGGGRPPVSNPPAMRVPSRVDAARSRPG